MNTDAHGISDDDLRYIADCLGREPKGVAGVPVRDSQGHPVVISNRPLIAHGGRYMPFPTLYWLVDPSLHAAIADAERKGGVHAIEALLKEDDERMLAHLGDSWAYANARAALLSLEEKLIAEELGLLSVLVKDGIGGVANHRSVKCLHAQYAYHLTRRASGGAGTTVGRLMEERFAIKFEV